MKYFSLLYQGDVHPADSDKILPKEEFSLLLTAQEIIAKALEDGERYAEEKRQEFEVLREEHIQRGFQAGLEQFAEQMLVFDIKLKEIYHQLQTQIFSIALQAAKKMVARQLDLHPETIVDIVAQAIAPLRQHRRFTIYVNKADHPALEGGKGAIKEILERLESLTVMERDDLPRGGCIIESEAGIINAHPDNLWKALEVAFSKYQQVPKPL